MATQNPKIAETLKTLKRLKSEKNFDALLLSAQQALLQFPEESRFLQFLHEAQEEYVKNKLDSQIVAQLIEKKDYAALAAVYQRLLSILPSSRSLQNRLQKVQEKIQEGKKEEIEAYFTEAEKQITVMLQKNDYENAVKACHEILDQNPQNKTFIKLLVKADAGLEKEMDQLLQVYYKEDLPKFTKEYQAAKDQFIRI
ncbi:MAG: hypothetical protein WC777_05880 [Candidatus Gracilibacteria bacterium]|jgi:hypothetical protein